MSHNAHVLQIHHYACSRHLCICSSLLSPHQVCSYSFYYWNVADLFVGTGALRSNVVVMTLITWQVASFLTENKSLRLLSSFFDLPTGSPMYIRNPMSLRVNWCIFRWLPASIWSKFWSPHYTFLHSVTGEIFFWSYFPVDVPPMKTWSLAVCDHDVPGNVGSVRTRLAYQASHAMQWGTHPQARKPTSFPW